MIMDLMTHQVKSGHLKMSWRGLSERKKACFYPVVFNVLVDSIIKFEIV